MTQEAQATKDFYNLSGGLNTEINELNFPDGYTRDEANYELLIDGSRRRRKGLAAESGAGTALTTDVWRTAECNQTYVWTNVGGDPNKKLVVYRKGLTLSFANADETISDSWYSGDNGFVDVSAFDSTGATSANTLDVPLSFSQGRGYLFVTGPYTKSFYVTYNVATDDFTARVIDIVVRDFADIVDGIAVGREPTTLTADHSYNLQNRGWNATTVAGYFSDVAKYPSKSSIWHTGYIRTYGASVAEKDGTRSWSSAKLDAEVFSSSSAPRGALFISPYDTTIGYGLAASGAVAQDITTWTYVNHTTYWTVTLTVAADPSITLGDEFVITGNHMTYEKDLYWKGVTVTAGTGFNGTWTAASSSIGAGPYTFTFDWTSEPTLWSDWVAQYDQYGILGGADSLARSTGAAHNDSFNAIEFHAGRVFYAGMKNSEFADTIMFSQIADSTAKFGRCYQEADPTDENFNAITTADGGTIIIAGMGGVQNLVSIRNSVIVLGRDGVWEISGGQRGVFTADGYSAKKLSSQGANAPDGWVRLEDSLIYTGPGGIFMVAPNQYTGQLEVTSVSERTVQTLWNQKEISQQEGIKVEYDDALRRVYFMFPASSTEIAATPAAAVYAITSMLVFDARVGGWFKYTFDAPTDNVLLTGFAIPNADDTSGNKKMKFIYQASTTSVQVADFAQTTFDDWDGTNGPLPYLLTGHDAAGGWQKRKQAPVIVVYSKRTETGYVDNGTGWDPTNASSTLMSAYWDWSDDSVTNKQGSQQQVYRHVRQFVPAAADDVDGYPVVVTRSKVRGRGRSLQLRFDGDTDLDSHILGFTTNYKVTRKI